MTMYFCVPQEQCPMVIYETRRYPTKVPYQGTRTKGSPPNQIRFEGCSMSPNSDRFAQKFRVSAAFLALQSLLFLLFFTSFTHAASPLTRDGGSIRISAKLPPGTALKPYNAVLAVTG